MWGFLWYCFSQAGIHVLTLLDIYPCGNLMTLWFLIFETIAIAWVFGGKRWHFRTIYTLTRLWRSVRDMTGVKNLRYFWLFSTMILAPLALMVTCNSPSCNNILLTGLFRCPLRGWNGEQHRWKHPPVPLQCLDCWCVVVFSLNRIICLLRLCNILPHCFRLFMQRGLHSVSRSNKRKRRRGRRGGYGKDGI